MRLKGSRLGGIMVFLLILGLWEWLSRADIIYTVYFPPVTVIAKSFILSIFSGELLNHTLASLSRFIRGYALAAFLATLMGIAMGYFRPLFKLFEPLVEVLRPMPSPAIIPIAILFFGIEDRMKIAVTLYACSWPILINTIDGVKSVDRTLINTARTLGLSRWQIIRKIIVPAASPQIMTGWRISLAIALILVTTAEMVISKNGLGFFVLDKQQAFQIDKMYAGIFMLAILGYVLNRAFLAMDGQLMGWHKGLTRKELL